MLGEDDVSLTRCRVVRLATFFFGSALKLQKCVNRASIARGRIISVSLLGYLGAFPGPTLHATVTSLGLGILRGWGRRRGGMGRVSTGPVQVATGPIAMLAGAAGAAGPPCCKATS